MSKSAEVHKKGLPYCHPTAGQLPPSKAAHYLAETYGERNAKQRVVVDAGCGEGRNTLFLLSKGLKVIAIDASEENLRRVRGAVAEARIPPEIFRCCLADLVERIPVKSGLADAVLDVWVLGSAILRHDGRAGARRYLTEVYRILKPGGLFVCEFETLKPRRSSEGLRKYLANLLGQYFSILTSQAIHPDYVRYIPFSRQQESLTAIFAVASKVK